MRLTTPRYGHLALVPRCAACGDTIFRHERVVALVGDEKSEIYRGRTPPFRFPQIGYPGREYDGFVPCRTPVCGACTGSPQTVPLHYDCFVVFIRRSPLEPEALARLWTVGCCRNPWPKAPLLHLVPHEQFVNTKALREFAHISGFPPLRSLPPELVELIRQLTPHALLWRALSTIELADRLAMPPQPLHVLPLRYIEAWERGRPVVGVSGLRPPVMRLEIDSDGIRKIDRLPETPAYQPDDSANALAYIVEKEDDLAGIQAHFQDGLLQLRLPPSASALRIWNTSAPPAWRNCFFSNWSNKLSWQHFRVIDLATTRGITFFYSTLGRLTEVHVHCASDPCAVSTYNRLSNRQQKFTLWIYLPISRFDEVTAIGVRGLSEILIRTQLAGDIFVGARYREPDENRLLGGSGERIAFLYGDPQDGEGVPFVGGYCPTWKGRLPPNLKPEVPNPMSGFNDEMCFSSASLDQVSSVSVFYDEETGFCRGMLFEYENGGLRTVGQCRLHVDLNKAYAKPLRLCFCGGVSSVSYWRQEIHGIHVEFRSNQSHHEHVADDGWQCQNLSGILIFWFSNRCSLLSVDQA